MSKDSSAEPLPQDSVQPAVASKSKPFLKWVGGKSQLLPHLIARMPSTFHRYIEPFVGGGALFFAVQPTYSYLADLNSELLNCYEVVKESPLQLVHQLSSYRYEKDFYYSVRELDRKPDFKLLPAVERAARLVYLNKTCFNGLYRVNSKGYFNVPFGRYDNPRFVDESNLLACSNTLQRTVLACESFDKVLEVAEAGDFVYFDPPYAPVSDTSDFTSYVTGGFDDVAQEMLLLVCLQLNQRGVKWMVSNSNAALIHELYRGFKIESIYATRSINSKAEKRGAVVELLIRNYTV